MFTFTHRGFALRITQTHRGMCSNMALLGAHRSMACRCKPGCAASRANPSPDHPAVSRQRRWPLLSSTPAHPKHYLSTYAMCTLSRGRFSSGQRAWRAKHCSRQHEAASCSRRTRYAPPRWRNPASAGTDEDVCFMMECTWCMWSG